MIPADNAQLGIAERRFVADENKAWELGNAVDRIRDPYVRMSLTLQQAFGLRREEAIKLQPSYADRGDCIVLKGSWTKGGRPRTVPITTPEQRVARPRKTDRRNLRYRVPELATDRLAGGRIQGALCRRERTRLWLSKRSFTTTCRAAATSCSAPAWSRCSSS